MHLRFEVHLFLWVAASIASALTIYCAMLPIDSSFEVFSRKSISETARSENIASHPTVPARRLISAPPHARTLFPPPATAEVFETADPATVEPMLKGILMSGAELRAVFFDPSTGAYRTAQEGEAVGAFRLHDIEADRVVLKSPDGDRVLYLRGAGEHP